MRTRGAGIESYFQGMRGSPKYMQDKQETVNGAHSRQEFAYDDAVQKERFSLRLDKVQEEQLRAVAKRLNMDWANTVRLAITRLCQLEGIIEEPALWDILRQHPIKPEDEH